MNQSNQPLVSVVIPCYNHENFVQDSIQSVINQTYQNIELIIIDDGSKDGSVEKIKEMIPACQERFIRFEFRHRSNKGLSATLNEALEWCEGIYFSALASDDYYHKDKIFFQAYYLQNNNDKKFCITKSFVVDDLNNVLNDQTLRYNLGLNENIQFNDVFTFKVHLPVTGLYNLKILRDELRGFDESITAEDYDLYLRLLEFYNVGILDCKLYYYRSPSAIGGEGSRPVMRLDVSNSHRVTIEKFKHHKLYNEAILCWNYRRFIYFSSYSKTKKYAVKGGFKSLSKFDIYYFKAIFRIVFYWKKYYGKL